MEDKDANPQMDLNSVLKKYRMSMKGFKALKKSKELQNEPILPGLQEPKNLPFKVKPIDNLSFNQLFKPIHTQSTRTNNRYNLNMSIEKTIKNSKKRPFSGIKKLSPIEDGDDNLSGIKLSKKKKRPASAVSCLKGKRQGFFKLEQGKGEKLKLNKDLFEKTLALLARVKNDKTQKINGKNIALLVIECLQSPQLDLEVRIFENLQIPKKWKKSKSRNKPLDLKETINPANFPTPWVAQPNKILKVTPKVEKKKKIISQKKVKKSNTIALNNPSPVKSSKKRYSSQQ